MNIEQEAILETVGEGVSMVELPSCYWREAGQLLGRSLAGLDFTKEHAIVLGLARGGVPVAAGVAEELRLPLDTLVVRKLGVPGSPELAMGAAAGGKVQVLDHELIEALAIPANAVSAAAAKAVEEGLWREHYYRAEGCRAVDLHDRTVILVDDGLATGFSMLAAAHHVNGFGAKKAIVAVPVGTEEACSRLKKVTHACICLATPAQFHSVSQWYLDFSQVEDEDVQRILEQHRRRFRPGAEIFSHTN